MLGLLRNKKAQSPVRNKTPKVSVSCFRRRFLTGQSTAEYAILIGVIVAVAIGIQTYVKRGLQGRFKTEVDDMAAGTSSLGTTGQYEPYYLQSQYTTQTTQDTHVLKGTAKNPTRTHNESLTQSGNQQLLAPTNN